MSDRISADVYILSERDLQDRLAKEFKRGIERGKFESSAAYQNRKVSGNCANWQDGRCESCGVQWQSFEVGADYECPHFHPRR